MLNDEQSTAKVFYLFTAIKTLLVSFILYSKCLNALKVKSVEKMALILSCSEDITDQLLISSPEQSGMFSKSVEFYFRHRLVRECALFNTKIYI